MTPVEGSGTAVGGTALMRGFARPRRIFLRAASAGAAHSAIMAPTITRRLIFISYAPATFKW